MSDILARVAEMLQRHSNILIITHYDPDGDAAGSLSGLGHLCVRLGKQVRLYCHSAMPAGLDWLNWPVSLVRDFSELRGWCPDLLVLVDCATAERGGPESSDFFAGKRPAGWENTASLCIDHHSDNPHFAQLNWVDAEAGATAQLIGQLAGWFAQPLSGDLGEAIYLGMVNDTGNFTYANTSSTILRMAADILDLGLRPEEFTRKGENNWSSNRMQLWGELMRNISIRAEGRVVSVRIELSMLKKYRCDPSDLEGFVSFLRRLKGVDATLLVREKPAKLSSGANSLKGCGCKISLRSLGGENSVDVQAIAAHFGGGGHKSAAGASTELTPFETEKAVLELLIPAVEALHR
ncbi:MAG: bifunctional oligoribonuclease/PAP phosphatase NrnA [Deltaproteobacteria bacterium]|jgi:phosphoesterase RecJ-like protein|nr:bifunctional oligoribonuclease/PAP phosphatase NrnA [Deltaproteobacteria bacterium]